MIELVLGFLLAGLLGARGGVLVAAGLGIGLLVYGLSCLVWSQWACWWPWCTARRAVAAGPGRRRRTRMKCLRCGGTGLVDRWGTRLLRRRGG